MFRRLFYPVSFLLLCVLSTNTFAGLLADPDLVIYYSFDEVTDIVADQSGNGHDGVINGDITPDPDGKRNGAARFATGSYLDLDGPSIPLNPPLKASRTVVAISSTLMKNFFALASSTTMRSSFFPNS